MEEEGRSLSGGNKSSAASASIKSDSKSSTRLPSDDKRDNDGGNENGSTHTAAGEMVKVSNEGNSPVEGKVNASQVLSKDINTSLSTINDERDTLLDKQGEANRIPPKEQQQSNNGKENVVQNIESPAQLAPASSEDVNAAKEAATIALSARADLADNCDEESLPLLQQDKAASSRRAGKGTDIAKKLRRSMLLDSNVMPLYAHTEPAAREGGMHLKWDNIRYHVEGRNESNELTQVPIIHNASGEAKPGEMIGIIGGSGAGKTSLLNILSGRISGGKVTGNITANGKRRELNWRWITSYVEQDDHLLPFLTVRETFTFVAMMKSPKGLSKKEKLARVEQLMRTLGLLHVADSRIGNVLHRGVSGGERKRVSIGIELITNPKLIFLDEPTSGLDALTALSVMETIKSLVVKEGISAIVTIHQPRLEISSLFSRIILLSQGHMIFFGHVTETIKYFEDQGYPLPQYENPTDFFIDMITIDKRTSASTKEGEARLEKFVESWKRNQQCLDGTDEKQPSHQAHPSSNTSGTAEQQQMTSGEQEVNEGRAAKFKNERSISFVEETYYLAKRDIMSIIRDLGSRKLRAVVTLVASATLCVVFFQSGTDYAGLQNRLGLMFVLTTRSIGLSMNPLVTTLKMESAAVARERYSVTYRVLPYFTAKFLTNLPESLAYTLVQCIVVYYVAGLRTDGFYHFLETLTILLLTNICATSFALFIVASSPSIEVTNYLFSVNTFTMAIFGSSLVSSTNLTWIIRWMKYLCIAYYPYQAMTQNEISGRTFGGVSGSYYLNLYGLNEMSFWNACVALVVYTMVTFWAGYLGLLFRAKPRMLLI